MDPVQPALIVTTEQLHYSYSALLKGTLASLPEEAAGSQPSA